MSSRALDLGLAANSFVTVLPDLSSLPNVGDVLSVKTVSGGMVATGFNSPGGVGAFLPLTGGTLTGNLTVANAGPTGLNTLLALNQPNLGASQYGALRIGIDANTNFMSGYMAFVPSATANQSQLVLGVRGYPADMISMTATGLITENASVYQTTTVNGATVAANGISSFRQGVSVSGSGNMGSWIAFNQWNVNNDVAAMTGYPMWHTGINYNYGGAGFTGNRGGLWVNMTQTGAVAGSSGAGGINALATGVNTNNTFGGTNPGPGASGALFGSNFSLNLFAGTTNIQGGQGLEIDLNAASGVTYQGFGGISLVTTSAHVQPGIMLQNTAISVAGQPSSIGFDIGMLLWSRGLQSGSSIIAADYTADNGASSFAINRGLDLRPMTFGNDAIATSGFAVGPTGRVRVGTGYFDVLAGGAAIDVSGAICTAGTLTASVTTTYAADGNHYWCDDPYGGIWSVTFTGSSITAISLIVAGTVKGTPPANPITLTPRGRLRIFVPGTITANLTWDTTRNALSIQPSGGAIMINAGCTITSGSAAPAATQPAGSIYMRTGGASGARLYVSAGAGTWTAVAGV